MCMRRRLGRTFRFFNIERAGLCSHVRRHRRDHKDRVFHGFGTTSQSTLCIRPSEGFNASITRLCRRRYTLLGGFRAGAGWNAGYRILQHRRWWRWSATVPIRPTGSVASRILSAISSLRWILQLPAIQLSPRLLPDTNRLWLGFSSRNAVLSSVLE